MKPNKETKDFPTTKELREQERLTMKRIFWHALWIWLALAALLTFIGIALFHK